MQTKPPKKIQISRAAELIQTPDSHFIQTAGHTAQNLDRRPNVQVPISFFLHSSSFRGADADNACPNAGLSVRMLSAVASRSEEKCRNRETSMT